MHNLTRIAQGDGFVVSRIDTWPFSRITFRIVTFCIQYLTTHVAHRCRLNRGDNLEKDSNMCVWVGFMEVSLSQMNVEPTFYCDIMWGGVKKVGNEIRKACHHLKWTKSYSMPTKNTASCMTRYVIYKFFLISISRPLFLYSLLIKQPSFGWYIFSGMRAYFTFIY